MTMFDRHLGYPMVAWRPAGGIDIGKASVDVCELVAMGTGECVLLFNGQAITVDRDMSPSDVSDEYERRMAEAEANKKLEDVACIVSDAARRGIEHGIRTTIEAACNALEVTFPAYRWGIEADGFRLTVKRKS